eukprot:scaffold73241_cov52-Phaeocystis_antarctica.AAC.2
MRQAAMRTKVPEVISEVCAATGGSRCACVSGGVARGTFSFRALAGVGAVLAEDRDAQPAWQVSHNTTNREQTPPAPTANFPTKPTERVAQHAPMLLRAAAIRARGVTRSAPSALQPRTHSLSSSAWRAPRVSRRAAAASEALSLHVRPGASVLYVRATRTSLLRAVRTRGAEQLAPGAGTTVRTPYTYQPRPCRTYHVVPCPCTMCTMYRGITGEASCVSART